MSIEKQLKEILGGTYGGPSLSYEDGKFVIYWWYDAPVSTLVWGKGSTIKKAIKNFQTKELKSEKGELGRKKISK